MKRLAVTLVIGCLVAACGNPKSQEVASKTASQVEDNTPPAERWAAFAYGIEWFDRVGGTGNSYFGRAYSEGSELAAKDTAIGACHHWSCEIKVYVQKGCIGLAQGFDREGRMWYGFGAVKYDGIQGQTVADRKRGTRLLAGETAIEGCVGGTQADACTTLEAFCTWDTVQSSSEAIRRWVEDMGGERDPGVKNTLQYLSVAAEPLLRNSGLTFQQARCVVTGHWVRIAQVAEACQLSTNTLDHIYSLSN